MFSIDTVIKCECCKLWLQREAVNSDLVFAVSGSSGLVDALDQRGINATETRLLFSSGSPGAALAARSASSSEHRGCTANQAATRLVVLSCLCPHRLLRTASM